MKNYTYEIELDHEKMGAKSPKEKTAFLRRLKSDFKKKFEQTFPEREIVKISHKYYGRGVHSGFASPFFYVHIYWTPSKSHAEKRLVELAIASGGNPG